MTGGSLGSDAVVSAVDSKIASVRTQSLDFSFNELADMYRAEELIIRPDFQRLFRWTAGAQSRFIESLLLELPVPPIFLIEREDRIYELIDGLQRISSYLNFRGLLGNEHGPLTLVDCDIVTELNGMRQENLPRSLDIKLKRSYIRAEILRKESDPRLRYHMFKRLNTGGEILSEQEVRNATIRLLSNRFNELLGSLSQNPDFMYCIDTVSAEAKLRRTDEELILRFFAFKNNISGYKHDYADFLTEYMEDVSDPASGVEFDYEAESSTFTKTFQLLRILADTAGINERIFGSVTPSSPMPRGQFSGYHFEAITLGIQAVLDDVDLAESATLDRLAEALRQGKSDPEFLRNTGGGKNDPNPLRRRIEFFERKFREALDGTC